MEKISIGIITYNEELNIDEMINLYREINYDRKFI